MTLALDASGLVKRFGAVSALTDGRLRVGQGEIHALLGANGCGKSTLCKIVAGAVAPDAGSLTIAGRPARLRHPRDAEALGVALFFQELSLVPQLTVAENLFLGREPTGAGGFVDRRAMRTQGQALIDLFGPAIAARLVPGTLVAGLPPDLRQVVEILKVLARRPRLMIMDEATAALDADQARILFDILRARTQEGVSTIMISHRLDEVFAVADRITVMRNGATTAELDRDGTDPDTVVGHMIGTPGRTAATDRRAAPQAGSPVLAGAGLVNAQVRNVSFALARGEILGLGGLQGQGQSALLQGLFGATPFRGG
ncbi:MAG: sugar ABC transporter ATP-binding protein, partial [Gemmatimonadaceae bacterium]|nr:sugar ABC transporter ATP-binding protein [Acetobacteraceae bacterium]